MSNVSLRAVVSHIRQLVAANRGEELSDFELLQEFAAHRDEAAFAAILRRHGPMVLGVCRHVLGHEQDAEDAYQATFLVLSRKASSIRQRGRLVNWLHGVAYRAAMKAKRNAARRRKHEGQVKDRQQNSPACEVGWREVQAILDQEIERLPEKYRAPFLLCCVETRSRADAACQLGIKEGTVWSRLAQARKLLQQRLARRGVMLSAVLGCAAISGNGEAATVPANLAAFTLKVAMAYAASKTAAAGLASAKVMLLAEGVIKAMFMSKLKIATAVILTVGLAATSVSALAFKPISVPETPYPQAQKAAPLVQDPDPSLARIVGRVVDEAGKPVPGAVVRFAGGSDTKGTKAARDGSFHLTLDQPAARYVTLLASAEGGAQQGLARLVDTDTPLKATANIQITLKPSRTLTAHVTDSRAKPIPGASVAVIDEYTPLASSETDRGGNASLRIPVDAQVWWVVAMKPGAGFDYFENYKSWPSRTLKTFPAKVSLVLEGARTVQIQATDSNGKPLPGVSMLPWTIHKKGKIAYANLSGFFNFTVGTDQQGIATFDWIPKDLKESLSFLCSSKQFHLSERPVFDPSREETRLTARLLRNTRYSGKITLPDGKPAAGILVQAEGRGGGADYCRTLARAGADGSYSLILYPEQSYIIAVTDDDWAAPSYTGVVVHEGETRKDLDFRLVKGTLIHGDVTIGPKEKPADSQTITLIQQSDANQLVRWTSTDNKGHYRIRVGPGTYQISGPEINAESLIIRTEEKIEMNFHVTRLSRGLLTGTVVAKEVGGKSVASAVVKGESIFGGASGTHAGFEAAADDRGRFETERWMDRMNIYARDPQGTLAGLMVIGEDDEKVEIILNPAAKLSGRIVDLQGKPLAAMRIMCSLHVDPKNESEGRAFFDVRTNEKGEFTVGGLLEGAQCRISLDWQNKKVINLKQFRVEAAKTIKLGDLTVDLRSE